jgi:hypothetical protein
MSVVSFSGYRTWFLFFYLLYSFFKYFDNNQDQKQRYNDDHDEKNFCFGISHAKNHQPEN